MIVTGGDSASLGGREDRRPPEGLGARRRARARRLGRPPRCSAATTTPTAPVADRRRVAGRARAGRRGARARDRPPAGPVRPHRRPVRLRARPRGRVRASARPPASSTRSTRSCPAARSRRPSASTATATIIEEVAEEADHDPDTLEAMVYLESAGFPDARAGRTADAVGLTQILAETGQNLLDMRIDVSRSARLTRQIARAERRGQARAGRAAAGAAPARRRALRPAEGDRGGRALPDVRRGRARRQRGARGRQLPHGRRQPADRPRALRRRRRHAVRRALLRLEPAAPRARPTGCSRRSATTRRRTCGGSRRRATSCGAGATTRRRSPSAPGASPRRTPARSCCARSSDTAKFAHAAASSRRPTTTATSCRCRRATCSAPACASTAAWASSPAGSTGRARSTAACAPRRSRCSSTWRAGTETISDRQPLVVTSTVRDQRYQRQLLRRNTEATPGYSLHTTGYAFDVAAPLPQPRARAGVPVHARPPDRARPHRVGARAARRSTSRSGRGRRTCCRCSSR